MKSAPVKTKSVCITGCSSGIGAATALHLRSRGWLVIPTARKPEDLQQLRADGFQAVQLDTADARSVAQAAGEILKISGGQLGALVNNAGLGQAGAMEDLTRDTIRYQFEVNVFGVQDLTNRFIPVFRRQGYGRIVNVSSVLGRIVLPFLGCYSASKFALEAVSDALRIELAGSGVTVSLIEPGPIITEFRRNAAERAKDTLNTEGTRFSNQYRKEIDRRIQNKPEKQKPFSLPPGAVAVKIAHALESASPRRRYCVTLPAYMGAFLRRFMPDGLMDAVLLKSRRRQET